MAFEPVDTKYQTDGPRELRIHSSTGTGYLTAGAVREWFQDTKQVTLFVDREHSQLGIKRQRVDDADTYKINTTGGGNGASLAIKSVFRELDIETHQLDENYRFPLEYDNDERLVVADLTELVEAETGAVHCQECGKRCANEPARKSHHTRTHD